MAADSPRPVEDVAQRLSRFFKALTLSQRLLLIGGAVLVGGVLWGFVVLLGQPKYVTPYSGLRPEEAQNLASPLAVKNIRQQSSADGGSLLVTGPKLDTSRVGPAATGPARTARQGS